MLALIVTFGLLAGVMALGLAIAANKWQGKKDPVVDMINNV